jgi:hypothetical protein
MTGSALAGEDTSVMVASNVNLTKTPNAPPKPRYRVRTYKDWLEYVKVNLVHQGRGQVRSKAAAKWCGLSSISP